MLFLLFIFHICIISATRLLLSFTFCLLFKLLCLRSRLPEYTTGMCINASFDKLPVQKNHYKNLCTWYSLLLQRVRVRSLFIVLGLLALHSPLAGSWIIIQTISCWACSNFVRKQIFIGESVYLLDG